MKLRTRMDHVCGRQVEGVPYQLGQQAPAVGEEGVHVQARDDLERRVRVKAEVHHTYAWADRPELCNETWHRADVALDDSLPINAKYMSIYLTHQIIGCCHNDSDLPDPIAVHAVHRRNRVRRY
jgi:hypothetical protein